MVVVPADAVVLMPCLTEHPEDLADPASLSDPVALDDHEVADVRSGRILCWRHRSPPTRFRVEPTLHSTRQPSTLASPFTGVGEIQETRSPPEAPIALRGCPPTGTAARKATSSRPSTPWERRPRPPAKSAGPLP